MKPLLPILLWLWPCLAIAQAKEVSSVAGGNLPDKSFQKKDTALRQAQGYKPEIFTSGFIDIMNSGQVNAAARFLRLYIGEPGNLPNGRRRFAIPLSFYGGVSNNSFQGGGNNNSGNVLLRSNDHLVNQYINPMSGLINISTEGVLYFKKTTKLTRTGWLYQIGERILTGVRTGQANNPQTGKPVNFLNSFVTSGIYFQTGAWERNNSKNVGVFWLTARYHLCHSNAKQIKEFLPDIQTNGLYHGYSVGFGVEINNLVNIKAIYYKYAKQPEIDYSLPVYQFSFNYSLKN